VGRDGLRGGTIVNFGRIISSIWTYLKEDWLIIIGVAFASASVKSVTMLLVKTSYRRIAGEIEGRRKTLVSRSPVSIEGLKEMVGGQDHILSWILSRRYILAECLEKLKEEGLIVWSEELKTYCISK
jgi:hypothetical protein